ncbi:putative Zn-dependent hydrolase of beta-lactamase fold [Candidatus Nitrososphaera evergladensis SR1]|jgi:L-ascorbate metabolism protein UlaG (beta-lactamase superfamily)|uniref:Putative Zn-dependent hydrolase of beta-lactamase fold n=1 Tax=Candidatus Nitrososphaera evergladensis SR1 TaxID=1459636 RepID=A0A075MWP9_9ARCH|nr:MBL fold metallo-hydrolase [Candidatus Nitrososphaera evergladensis]AIF85072.1 putative Zn-dependent hydrolase of beta-lactamase fold [Candidatus Nitrososphaera evergladensis SR1]
MLDYKGIKFHWLGHDGFRIVAGGKTIYVDPYEMTKAQHGKNDADIVMITHNHYDHLSMDDLKQVVGKKTELVAAKECAEQLKPLGLAVKAVAPGDRVTVQGVQVEAVAAYNTNKKFHPKGDKKVGYVITLNGMRVYHSGDTDDIQEMSQVQPDIALVPVSGTYVMTADEAAKAVNEKIKPKMLAIPMHYASIVGSEKDAARFKELVRACPVEILERE